MFIWRHPNKWMERLIKGPVLEKAQVSRPLKTQQTSPGPALLLCLCNSCLHSQKGTMPGSTLCLTWNPVVSKMWPSKLLDAEHLLFHLPDPYLLQSKPRSSWSARPRLNPLSAEPSPASVPHLAGGSLGFRFASSSTSMMLSNTLEGHWGAAGCSAAAGCQGGTGLSYGDALPRVSLHPGIHFPLRLRKIRVCWGLGSTEEHTFKGGG